MEFPWRLRFSFLKGNDGQCLLFVYFFAYWVFLRWGLILSPGWNAMVWPWVTASLTSLTQAVNPSISASHGAGTTVMSHHVWPANVCFEKREYGDLKLQHLKYLEETLYNAVENAWENVKYLDNPLQTLYDLFCPILHYFGSFSWIWLITSQLVSMEMWTNDQIELKFIAIAKLLENKSQ